MFSISLTSATLRTIATCALAALPMPTPTMPMPTPVAQALVARYAPQHAGKPVATTVPSALVQANRGPIGQASAAVVGRTTGHSPARMRALLLAALAYTD